MYGITRLRSEQEYLMFCKTSASRRDPQQNASMIESLEGRTMMSATPVEPLMFKNPITIGTDYFETSEVRRYHLTDAWPMPTEPLGWNLGVSNPGAVGR